MRKGSRSRGGVRAVAGLKWERLAQKLLLTGMATVLALPVVELRRAIVYLFLPDSPATTMASFSIGGSDLFVASDGGRLVVNIGGVNPPSAATITNSLLFPPAIANPFAGAGVFLEPIPIGSRGSISVSPFSMPAPIFFEPRAAISDNPLAIGITDIDFEADDRGIGFGSHRDETGMGTEDDDILAGFDGDDTLLGMDGDDRLFGNRGNDFLLGGDDDDTLEGGRDDDRLLGNDGDDVLNGNRGDDEVLGGDGDDLILGGRDDDTLIGGEGEDTLIGDLGRNRLQGGDDADLFVLRTDVALADRDRADIAAADIIVDFNRDDRLGLTDGLTVANLTFVGAIVDGEAATAVRIGASGPFLAAIVGVDVTVLGGRFVPA